MFASVVKPLRTADPASAPAPVRSGILEPLQAENSDDLEQDAVSERIAARRAAPGIALDLSKVPVSPPRGASAVRPSSAVAAAPLPRALQTKLVVGSIDDPLEREADRMADQVMRVSAAPSETAVGMTLQRKCATCEEEEPEATLRARHQAGRDASGAEAPSVVTDVLRSPGEPLNASARAFFEPRFGRDFSQVRVHSDENAARSAQSIGARAYTVGRHIAFAQGQYAPGSDQGRHLLAHELTHTIQQGAARVQRRADEIRQDDEARVGAPDEMERYEEEAAAVQQVIRRSATWKGAAVQETVNPANTPFGGPNPITWHLLNGTKLETEAIADGAIKVPGITTFPLPSTDPTANYMAQVDTVPDQEGSADETVVGPGPWTKVVTKVQAGAVTGLAACAGAGNSTFTRTGKPSDDAVYQANRRHEDHHVADHKVAFEDAIGKWDKKLQDAKAAATAFTGATAADAITALWTAMGNTPTAAARSYRSQGFSKGNAFHGTPGGGPMARSNPVSNADCSTSGMDVTNPS